MKTVLNFAEHLDCVALINRAVSFDERLAAIYNVECKWSHNVKHSGGWGGRYITLAVGLQNASLEDQRNTFLHEVAHAMEFILYGRTGHSQNWWEAMIRLGQKPWETRYLSKSAVAALRDAQVSADDIEI